MHAWRKMGRTTVIYSTCKVYLTGNTLVCVLCLHENVTVHVSVCTCGV